MFTRCLRRALGAARTCDHQCLEGAIDGTSTTDGDLPNVGDTIFYFVTRKAPRGESVAERKSARELSPNAPSP